jgi:hypothetical protein
VGHITDKLAANRYYFEAWAKVLVSINGLCTSPLTKPVPKTPEFPQVTWAYFVDSITPSQKLAINTYSDNSYPVNTPCTPPGHPL